MAGLTKEERKAASTAAANAKAAAHAVDQAAKTANSGDTRPPAEGTPNPNDALIHSGATAELVTKVDERGASVTGVGTDLVASGTAQAAKATDISSAHVAALGGEQAGTPRPTGVDHGAELESMVDEGLQENFSRVRQGLDLALPRIATAPVRTVSMRRSEPVHPGGPTTADVHPDEVTGYLDHGWIPA